MGTLQLNQPYSDEQSAKAWAPQSTTKGLVQASERAQGQGEGGMKGEIVRKIITIEKKLQSAMLQKEVGVFLKRQIRKTLR